MDLKGQRWMKICKKILILNFWTHERQVSSGHSRCLWVDLSSTLSEFCQEPILFLRPPGCTRSQWLSVIAKHLPKAQQVHQTLVILQHNAKHFNATEPVISGAGGWLAQRARGEVMVPSGSFHQCHHHLHRNCLITLTQILPPSVVVVVLQCIFSGFDIIKGANEKPLVSLKALTVTRSEWARKVR